MLAAIVLVVAGCSTCDAIGCVTTLTVEAPDGLDQPVRVCLRAACVDLRSSDVKGSASATVDDAESRAYLEDHARPVLLVSSGGASRSEPVGRLKVDPNGSRCPGSCDVVRLTLGRDGDVVR